MRYLCIGYHDERRWATLAEAERCALIDESIAYGELLRRNGHCVNEQPLQSARAAVTLRFRDGDRLSVTDGPFAETKEQIGGVMLLEATDLNHAIQLMSQLPCMRVGGTLEIRPVAEPSEMFRLSQ